MARAAAGGRGREQRFRSRWMIYNQRCQLSTMHPHRGEWAQGEDCFCGKLCRTWKLLSYMMINHYPYFQRENGNKKKTLHSALLFARSSFLSPTSAFAHITLLLLSAVCAVDVLCLLCSMRVRVLAQWRAARLGPVAGAQEHVAPELQRHAGAVQLHRIHT